MPTGLDVDADVNTHFTWNYEQTQTALTKLYEKGKTSQWNATTDIDWSPDVEFGQPDPDITDDTD